MATSYDWQKFCEVAILETDFQKMRDRLAEAREAILRRLLEVPSPEADANELAAIDNALAALMVLEIEMLPENSGNGDDPELSGRNQAA
jgi:hypothetical protein